MPRLAVELDLPLERLGSDYGGYAVVPSELGPESVAYSFGTGEDTSFDVGLHRRFDMTVHGFDPTPRAITWVERQGFDGWFVFHPWGLAGFDGTARFTPPANPAHVSHTILPRSLCGGEPLEVPVQRLATIARRLGHERIDLLKMDIEGAEYEVIEDIAPADLARLSVRQILIEYHHHLDGVARSRTERSVRRLSRAGYAIVHVSETGRELTFVRRDLLGGNL